MNELVSAHYVAPKITLTGVEDPESHLTAFNAQMIISGGSDVVRCKMFMGTFTGTTIQWFNDCQMDIFPIFPSSPSYSENSFMQTGSNPRCCMMSSMCGKGKGRRERLPESVMGSHCNTSDPRRKCHGVCFRARGRFGVVL